MADAAMVRWTMGGAEWGEPEKCSAKPAVGAGSETPGAATQNQYSTGPAFIENRPVITLAQAAKLFRWYGSRWSNKVFFRIFKTGRPPHRLESGLSFIFFPSYLELKFPLAKINMHLYH